jgi:hypothetical protein
MVITSSSSHYILQTRAISHGKFQNDESFGSKGSLKCLNGRPKLIIEVFLSVTNVNLNDQFSI